MFTPEGGRTRGVFALFALLSILTYLSLCTLGGVLLLAEVLDFLKSRFDPRSVDPDESVKPLAVLVDEKHRLNALLLPAGEWANLDQRSQLKGVYLPRTLSRLRGLSRSRGEP